MGALALCLAVGIGCAHNARQRGNAAAPPPSWVEAPLMGEVEGDLEALERLQGQGTKGRLVRLDRLLDLFDAARFAEDEYARETLWTALGGHQIGIGDEATRDAIQRLLQEALAIEAAAEDAPLSDEDAEILADTIQLLTNDLQQPATAEDLSVRNFAYRELVQRGHERVADNARWRLYDHARGTLVGATQAAPEHRIDVAVQALYAARDSVEDLLADTTAHARPAPPSPDALWAVLGVHRVALSKDPRWKAVIGTRAADDDALRRTVLGMLPAPRDPDWRLPQLPRGTARADTYAPVVEVYAGKAVVDAGRPGSKPVLLRDEVGELARALQSAIARDGRGTVLLVAEPGLPAPELHVTLRALRRAQVSSLELAAKEPRLEGDGEVVVALPVFVARSADGTPGVRALMQARVAAHVTGRGAVLYIDGEPLSLAAGPRELGAQLSEVKRAYPRERIVRVTVASDVQYGQLVELVAALTGGENRRFGGVGWWAGGAPPAAAEGPVADARLKLRAALGPSSGQHVAVSQPYPLKDDDQKRLEAFTNSLAACLPELEDKRAQKGVRLALQFAEGKLVSSSLLAPKRKKAPRRFADCIDERAFGLRLRHHSDKISITVAIE